jgi:hypothetical protein
MKGIAITLVVPFFMVITLKRTPIRKAIPLINSTCHTSVENSVAYLADICDISFTNLSSLCDKKLDKHLPLFAFSVFCILD